MTTTKTNMKNIYSLLSEDKSKKYVPKKHQPSILDEFPELSKGKGKKQTYVVHTSLIEPLKQLKEDRFSARTTAFEELENKEVTEKRLLRTKMCNSVGSGKDCPHGKLCRFAHNHDELEVATCAFGSNCKLTRLVDGRYINCNRRRICKFKHENESKDEFFERTGLAPRKPVISETSPPKEKSESESLLTLEKPPVISVVKRLTPQQTEEVIPVDFVPENWDEESDPLIPTMSSAFKLREAAKLCTAIEVASTASSVIRVHKELAMEAFQMILDRGDKNIRFEII